MMNCLLAAGETNGVSETMEPRKRKVKQTFPSFCPGGPGVFGVPLVDVGGTFPMPPLFPNVFAAPETNARGEEFELFVLLKDEISINGISKRSDSRQNE